MVDTEDDGARSDKKAASFLTKDEGQGRTKKQLVFLLRKRGKVGQKSSRFFCRENEEGRGSTEQ